MSQKVLASAPSLFHHRPPETVMTKCSGGLDVFVCVFVFVWGAKAKANASFTGEEGEEEGEEREEREEEEAVGEVSGSRGSLLESPPRTRQTTDVSQLERFILCQSPKSYKGAAMGSSTGGYLRQLFHRGNVPLFLGFCDGLCDGLWIGLWIGLFRSSSSQAHMLGRIGTDILLPLSFALRACLGLIVHYVCLFQKVKGLVSVSLSEPPPETLPHSSFSLAPTTGIQRSTRPSRI